MCSHFRLAGVLALPLLLGACGMPIGIQIASLFADGVSYLTTEKTLTDHGISAVADQDCALWRGIEGEDICRDPDAAPADEGVQTALAELSTLEPAYGAGVTSTDDSDLPMELSQPAWKAPAPPKEPGTRIAMLGKEMRSGPGAAPEPAEPEQLILGTAEAKSDMTVKRIEPPLENPSEPMIETAALAPAPIAPLPPVVKVRTETVMPPTKATAPVKATPAGASYVIIASYHRAEDAARFSKRSAKWKPQVLEGTAKGRQVFRVAVGPWERKSAGRQAKQLRKAGFKGAWRLTLRKPIVETEMAALR